MWMWAFVGSVIGTAIGLAFAHWLEKPKYDSLPDTAERRRMNCRD